MRKVTVRRGGLPILLAGLVIVSLSTGAKALEDTLTFERCSSLNPPLDCPSGSDLPLAEQKTAVIGLLMEGEKMPAYEKVREWNTGLEVSGEPEGAVLSASNYIKDAWINVTALMPSVVRKNVLYVNSSGVLRTDYGYELARPEGYYNGEESVCGSPGRVNEFDDCKTEYPSNADHSYLEVFQNGVNISGGRLASFNSSSYNFFESKLSIRNEILSRHWKWEESGCCRTCKDGDVEYCCAFAYTCNYAGEDVMTSSLDLFDSATAKRAAAPQLSGLQIFFDAHREPVTGYLRIKADGLQSYALRFGDAVLKKRSFSYGVNYSFSPYNFLSLEAAEGSEFFVDGLQAVSSESTQGFETVIFETLKENVKSCEVTLEGFFFKTIQKCNYTVLPETVLGVDTDKFSYKEGEPIIVTVGLSSSGAPFSGYVDVSYGGQSEVVYADGGGFARFAADKNFNVVEARFKTDLNKSSAEASKPVHVSIGAPLSFFFFLAVAVLFVFAFERVLHRYVLQV